MNKKDKKLIILGIITFVLLAIELLGIRELVSSLLLGFFAGLAIWMISAYQGWRSRENTKEVLLEELDENVRRINEMFYFLIKKNKEVYEISLYPLFDRYFNSFLSLNGLVLLNKDTRKHLLYSQNGIHSLNSQIKSMTEGYLELGKNEFVPDLLSTWKEIRNTFKKMGKEGRWGRIRYQRINENQFIEEDIIEQARAISP